MRAAAAALLGQIDLFSYHLPKGSLSDCKIKIVIYFICDSLAGFLLFQWNDQWCTTVIFYEYYHQFYEKKEEEILQTNVSLIIKKKSHLFIKLKWYQFKKKKTVLIVALICKFFLRENYSFISNYTLHRKFF